MFESFIPCPECGAAIIASYVSDANYMKHIHWHKTLQQKEGASND